MDTGVSRSLQFALDTGADLPPSRYDPTIGELTSPPSEPLASVGASGADSPVRSPHQRIPIPSPEPLMANRTFSPSPTPPAKKNIAVYGRHRTSAPMPFSSSTTLPTTLPSPRSITLCKWSTWNASTVMMQRKCSRSKSWRGTSAI